MNAQEDNWRCTESSRLTDRVVGRLRLAAVGSAWTRAMAGLGAACFVLLLVRRFGGLGPEWLTVDVLAVVPVCAALIAVLVARKPTVLEAARKLDGYCGASDLFLTLAQLESAAGAYQSLIAEQAELRAFEIVPSTVIRWSWQRPMAWLSVGTCMLVSSVQFLPQLDPFGTVDMATAVIAVRKDLLESQRETKFRTAELASQRESVTLSDDVGKLLSELAAELQQLHADRSAPNAKALDARQRELEARWRDRRSGDEVSRLLEQSLATQFFGPSDKRTRQWAQELAKGQTESLNEAFDSLKESLQRLASTSDEGERRQLDRQARQALAELQRFAGSQLQSRPMESALKRAMSQLDAAQHDPGLQSAAAEASRESLDLAEAELQEIARAAAQLASLEKALSAIQSAKQMAQQGSEQASGENESAVQEFIEQYAALRGDAKQSSESEQDGSSNGQPGPSQQASTSSTFQPPSESSGQTGGRTSQDESHFSQGDSSGGGPGRLTQPPENDLANTGFRNAREAAGIDASRRLMRLRRQGLADAGESSQEYRELVRTLQKRVSTAIEVEEIPPGYVSGIRSYFDSLEQQTNVEQTSNAVPETSSATGTSPDASEVADEAP